MLSYLVIPVAFIKNWMSLAVFCLLFIFVGRVIGLIMVVQFMITGTSLKILKAYCWLSGKLVRQSTAKRLQPIISKSLVSHRERNTKFGMMFITTVMFFMVVKSTSTQMNSLGQSLVQRAMGGDLAVITIPKLNTLQAASSAFWS